MSKTVSIDDLAAVIAEELEETVESIEEIVKEFV